jgi:hypothetical protein
MGESRKREEVNAKKIANGIAKNLVTKSTHQVRIK